MSWFYAFTIYPLELAYKGIFTLCSDLLGSYGLALIALSLCTSFAIAPLKRVVSSAMRKEHELQLVLQPQLRKIREESKGAERHARTTRLYRRYAYHPIMGIRSILGVALQIPFLMAAYYMVEGLDILKGQSFWFLKDLSLPDGLLGGVNLLPFVMTLVNLGAVFTSSQMSRKDRIQACLVAFLFFVLLYGAPSALLFYWTLNNILSLSEGLVRNAKVGVEHRLTTICLLLIRKARSLWTAILSAQVRLSAVIVVIGLAGLFMLVRGLLGHGKYSYEMSAMLFGVFLLLIAISFLAKEKLEGIKKIALPQAVAVLAGVIGVSYILAKYGFHQGNAKKVAVKIGTVAGVACILTYGRAFLAKMYARVAPQKNELGALFLPAACLIAFLVFVYCPFMVFSSDPAVFEMTLEDFASGRFGTFFVAMICLVAVGALVRPIKWVFGSIFTMMALAALTFCFVVAPDVGVMDAFVFQKPEALTRWYNVYIDIAVMATVILAFTATMYLNKVKTWKNIVYAALTVLIVMTGLHYHTAKDNLASFKLNDTTADSNLEIPQYVKDFYTFSKHGKNVVVVMLDMFTGGNMNQLLEMYPELKTELDGFTWYEDVVTAGSSTLFGKPSILGGSDSHPLVVNEQSDTSLEEKISSQQAKFLSALQKNNFRLSVQSDDFFVPSIINKTLQKDSRNSLICSSKIWTNSKNWYEKKENLKSYSVQRYNLFLNAISFFNITPIFLKKHIYSDAMWMNTVSRSNFIMSESISRYADLKLPVEGSSIFNDIKNSFIYFESLLTHFPWGINELGYPSDAGGSATGFDFAADGTSPSHLRNEAFALKTLIQWFNWMKKNDIYDNTQIILVSDHSFGDSKELVSMWQGRPPVYAHGLILVKEYNARGCIKIEKTYQMATYDIKNLVLNRITTDNQYTPWINTNRERFHVSGNWRRDAHSKNKYNFKNVYKIQGPLYQKESWTKIQ